MNNTDLDRVVSPQGLTGLMPPRHLGRRIGMPNTVVRSFQAPRPIGPFQPGIPPSSLYPRSRGALSTLKLAWGGAVAPNAMPIPQPGMSMPGGGGWGAPAPGTVNSMPINPGLGGTLQTQPGWGAPRMGAPPMPPTQPPQRGWSDPQPGQVQRGPYTQKLPPMQP